ncbi:MAG: GFA family protein [Pseudolabrys sp.]
MLVPAEEFAYTKGAPKTYRRPDKADAVTREFCAVCGTHMISRAAWPATGGSKDRNAGGPFSIWRRAKGDLHGRRSAFPSHCGRRARL